MVSLPAARRCIVILSDKSSGSSALQEYLVRFTGGHHVERTRHNEHETLYWTKAASLLGRPQEKMLDSEVPIAPERARSPESQAFLHGDSVQRWRRDGFRFQLADVVRDLALQLGYAAQELPVAAARP